MKHTPGPWEVTFVDSDFPKQHYVYARIEPEVGYVGYESMGVYHDSGIRKRRLATLNDTARANAYLIAAAPDLLEACKDALSAMELIYYQRIDTDDEPAVVTGIKQAIAKAINI